MANIGFIGLGIMGSADGRQPAAERWKQAVCQ